MVKSWHFSARLLGVVSIGHANLNAVHNQVNDDFKSQSNQTNFGITKERCRKLVARQIQEVGAPGMVVAVSKNGKNVWSEGFGFSDVENEVPMHPNTLLRVASISKPFTSAVLGKMVENNEIDLDKPIQTYVNDFPENYFEENKVEITLRLLLSHLSGIRHYNKDRAEFYSTKHYKTVTDSLDMFKNDKLLHQPGEHFFYTTHGYTLISVAMEKASGKKFLSLMKQFFKEAGMTSTVPDLNDDIIYGRSRYYVRNEKGILKNAPHVDCSYKWAGGGFLSTVVDIVQFGDIMIYSYQKPPYQDTFNGMLKKQTVEDLWREAAVSSSEKEDIKYGMGWYVCPQKEPIGYCPLSNFEVSHTGGAVGASSILLIIPGEELSPVGNNKSNFEIRGICVAVLTNIGNVDLTSLAREIAREFMNDDVNENRAPYKSSVATSV